MGNLLLKCCIVDSEDGKDDKNEITKSKGKPINQSISPRTNISSKGEYLGTSQTIPIEFNEKDMGITSNILLGSRMYQRVEKGEEPKDLLAKLKGFSANNIYKIACILFDETKILMCRSEIEDIKNYYEKQLEDEMKNRDISIDDSKKDKVYDTLCELYDMYHFFKLYNKGQERNSVYTRKDWYRKKIDGIKNSIINVVKEDD